jgi:hypothetical protein
MPKTSQPMIIQLFTGRIEFAGQDFRRNRRKEV